MTQIDMVVNHLKEHGEITSYGAFEDYGITRVGAYICLLRRAGYDIETVREMGQNRYGTPTRYARYVLKGERSRSGTA